MEGRVSPMRLYGMFCVVAIACVPLAGACRRVPNDRAGLDPAGLHPIMVGYRVDDFEVGDGPSPWRVQGAVVAPGILRALGVRPQIGRLFLLQEYRADPQVVIVSHRLWQWRDEWVRQIGTPLKLNGRELTVIGVMQAGFTAPGGVDLLLPGR